MPDPALGLQQNGQALDETRPLLSVVVPVFNLAGKIGENVGTIRQRVEAALGEPIELIVVSDGSSDRSEERALENDRGRTRDPLRPEPRQGVRRAHRRAGARGRFVSFVDADLDLDPAPLADYLRLAESESLDVVIGSKRHPGLARPLPALAPRRQLAVPAARARSFSSSTSATRRSGSSCSGARSPRRSCRCCS